MTQLLKCHIRQRRGNYMHQVAGMCVCVGRQDKVIVLSEFGELVDSQKPQETGDQSCVNPTTITVQSAQCNRGK